MDYKFVLTMKRKEHLWIERDHLFLLLVVTLSLSYILKLILIAALYLLKHFKTPCMY